MATEIDLGNVAIVSKGIHSLDEAYEPLNEVQDEFTQNWYRAKKSVPAQIALDNEEYWELVRDNTNVGGEDNVQSDWDESDTTSDSFIKNKPRTITEDEVSKLAGIEDGANKYTHPTGEGNEHVPAGGTADKFLAGDRTWKKIETSSSLLLKPILTVEGNIVTSSYETSNYSGTQTASNWYVFNMDGTLAKQELNSSFLTEYVATGLDANTDYKVKKENVSGEFISPISDEILIHTPNMSIDTPTDITVEGSPDEVPDNAEVKLNTLPNATNTTIDKIRFEVRKKSDNSLVGTTQETTDLTLPITFNSSDLEENIEYDFRIQCASETDSIQSTWSTTEGKTATYVTPTEGGYNNGDRIATIVITDNNIPWKSSYDDSQSLIDGSNSKDLYFSGDNILDKSIIFDFGEYTKISSIKVASDKDGKDLGIWTIATANDGDFRVVEQNINFTSNNTVTFATSIKCKKIKFIGEDSTPSVDPWLYELVLGD